MGGGVLLKGDTVDVKECPQKRGLFVEKTGGVMKDPDVTGIPGSVVRPDAEGTSWGRKTPSPPPVVGSSWTPRYRNP